MSGRSAYVRKQKTKVTPKAAPSSTPSRHDSVDDSTHGYASYPSASTLQCHQRRTSISHASSNSNSNSHKGPFESSTIEKSSLRTFMDAKSDSIRNRLAFKLASKPSQESIQYLPPPVSTLSRPSSRKENVSSSTPNYPAPATPRKLAKSRALRVNTGGLGVIYDDPLNFDGALHIQRWVGGRRPRPWNELGMDRELWTDFGDTTVFLGNETQPSSLPPASFRLHSSTIRKAGSPFLKTILRGGKRDRPELGSTPAPSSPPESAYSSQGVVLLHGLQTTPSPLNPPRMPSSGHSMNLQTGQPTPPGSAVAETVHTRPVEHEIYFPAPLDLVSKLDVLRYHITTRNVFALFLHKSLVGIGFYQALTDLLARLQMYMPPDCDVARMIIEYIMTSKIDDVRSDPRTAAGLLAWSERVDVRWQEGWREGYVHCAGMYDRVKVLPEYHDISAVTRALLEKSHLQIQVQIQEGQHRLDNFDFKDMWPMNSAQPPVARASFDRFRKFLFSYYKNRYLCWPPLRVEEHWLTRVWAMRLQAHFGALYDFLVDRDIHWDKSHGRDGRDRNIVSKGGKPHFRADSDDLPMTDIILGFDNRHKFPHIPHPFPLCPAFSAAHRPPKKSFFTSKKDKTDELARETRIALAYSEASNINTMGSNAEANELVQEFMRFEKSDRSGDVDPYEARRGRWILIYGILQVLATVSVDTPDMRHDREVQYFLNPRLRGTPPWISDTKDGIKEATHTASYCWTTRSEDQRANVHDHGMRMNRQILVDVDKGFPSDNGESSGIDTSTDEGGTSPYVTTPEAVSERAGGASKRQGPRYNAPDYYRQVIPSVASSPEPTSEVEIGNAREVSIQGRTMQQRSSQPRAHIKPQQGRNQDPLWDSHKWNAPDDWGVERSHSSS
ncbi:MAG: hypothetical protein M1827_001926 [Pycnora praestabilis]|nr:MAG: hypothetical protein M1827_001926 [Pycnora praestabilis]